MERNLFSADELKDGQMRALQFGLRSVLVCRVEGQYYAINNLCSHLKVPLAIGNLEGNCVVCRAHGARFDVRTGKMTARPVNDEWKEKSILNKLAAPVIPTLFAGDIESFPVSVREGRVFLSLPD